MSDRIHVNPPAAVRAAAADLKALAGEINREHAAGEKLTGEGLEHFLRAGLALTKAKEQCVREGTPFGPWVEMDCPTISERQSQRCMRLAREAGGSKSDVTSGVRDLRETWAMICGNAATRQVPCTVRGPEATTKKVYYT